MEEDAEDFKYFKWGWNQYVRESGKTDDAKLRNQLFGELSMLLNCQDTDLKKAVYNALSDRVDTFTQDNLLKQI